MSLPELHRIIEVDGRQWIVAPVIEGVGWDAELPVRRHNWLSLETHGERRFISPLPEDWDRWTDDHLREQVRAAPRSNRRSMNG